MLEFFLIVKQAQQKRSDSTLHLLVPPEASYHTVAIAIMLHLEHRALVRFIDTIQRLRHHTVEPRALKPLKPIRRNTAIGRRRRQMNRRSHSNQRLLQRFSSKSKGLIPQIARSLTKQIEKYHCRRTLLRQQLDSRCRRMQTQLQFLEIERAALGNHNLAISHIARGQTAA